MPEVVSEKQSWNFPQGHEIAPGRTTLRGLGGGNRYEVYLVWDQRRFAVMEGIAERTPNLRAS